MSFLRLRRWWLMVAVCLTSFLLSTTCEPTEADAEDAPRIAELRTARWIEPRLTSSVAWGPCTRLPQDETEVVSQSDCQAPHVSQSGVSLGIEACEQMTKTHAEAVKTLITRPACIDAVVEQLDQLAHTQKRAALWNDLSAAYYVRGQKDDRPSDLLRALDAAQRSAAIDSTFAPAQFNLALADEALGFPERARAAWNRAARLDRTAWAAEAGRRRDAIDRATTRANAQQWTVNRQQLADAIHAGDRSAIAQLIRPFPAAAQRHVEEVLLPGERWRDAALIAAELAKVTGDRYLRDTVASITAAQGSRRALIRRGLAAFGKARGFDRAFKTQPAAAAYRESAEAFAKSGCPMEIGARLGYAIQAYRLSEDKREPKAMLERISREAKQRGYGNVWARAESNLANLLQIDGQYLDAIAHYDVALEEFRRMHDDEDLANVHMRKAGIFRVLGHEEAALIETFRARQYASKLVDMTARHLLAGVTAATVLALDFPSIAFDYQSDFLNALLEEMAKEPGDEQIRSGMRVNLAIAKRARAAIRLHLGDQAGAEREIDEASAIAEQQSDRKIRNALLARIEEAKGEAALPAHPEAAIEAFGRALRLSGPVRYRTFQTILLVRQAEAYRLAGNGAAAERNLRAALKELNAEETDLLDGRRRGQGEGLWADYFSRFQETYYVLIRLLIATGRKSEALAYAEKSRAYEPLKLVLELPVGDETLRKIDMRSVNPRAPQMIQSALPPGTFIIEYEVGKDQTFAWIISHDELELRTLSAGRAAVEEWTHRLQHKAAAGDIAGFENALSTPFRALLDVPIDAVSKMKNGHMPGRRLVIVPDRFMHGLPFAALRNAHGRYLVQDFPISVVASATLYAIALGRQETLAANTDGPTELLVGDPAFDKKLDLTQGLDRLPFAHAEAVDIAALYGPKAKVLLDDHATVPAFLEAAKDSTIIHFAGHAIVNRHAPFGTLLLLAPAKHHNGLLYTDELLTRLELTRARLVVLAACSSAGGVPVGPEGLAPLVRPFVAAGVPAVVGSLWTINDRASQKVMVAFHERYKEGHDAAEALQLAQLGFVTDKNPAMPSLVWASFQTSGYAASPFHARKQLETGR